MSGAGCSGVLQLASIASTCGKRLLIRAKLIAGSAELMCSAICSGCLARDGCGNVLQDLIRHVQVRRHGDSSALASPCFCFPASMSTSVLKGKQRQDSRRDEEAGEQDPLLTHPSASSSSRRNNISAAALYRSLACILVILTCFHVSASWLSAREARHPSSRSGFPKFDPTLGDGHTPTQRNPAYMCKCL